jgi:L,D-transpeptidase-like protein
MSSRIHLHKLLGILGTASLFIGAPSGVHAQDGQSWRTASAHRAADADDDAGGRGGYSFKSRKDSISWARNRELAERATGYRLVVSLQDRHLWAIIGRDTVLSAPVAVAKGTTLEYGKREWTFETPRGMRTVLDKEADPIWQPPEWLYAETALEYGLKLGHLNNGQRIKLSDGRILTMRDGEAGLIDNGEFAALPTDEHIVFDNTLFVPPFGSKNRKIEGELGKYRLNLGEGYLLHGTPYKESIGMAATHGCVRMRDEDIEWLYEHVPVGTRVYIY